MLNLILAIVAVPLVAAAAVLALNGKWAGRLALLAAGTVTVLGVMLWQRAATGDPIVVSVSWMPWLGISANLRADRLGAFFVLLTGTIGLATVQYGRAYLGQQATPLFWSALLAFMGAMLGVVVSDSVVLLFVFWELTTITSALLIGFDYENARARRGAIQAFLVTAGGGLSLLAGIVLLGQIAGTYDLSTMAARSARILADPWHRVALGLILVGAFAKSAQFPLHFWLPAAMSAPTPVSAFLHSAAMVKAGVFLLGRMVPIFGASDMWLPTLATVGLGTYVISGWMALRADDLKQVLAYSTSAFLGVITAFYGYAGAEGAEGQLLHIAAHAFYKSSLFFLVGWIDKITGTRALGTLEREFWLRRPGAWIGAVLVALGAMAMAGLPFSLGFVSKEHFYQAIAGGKIEALSPGLLAAALGSALSMGYALKVLVGPFWGYLDPDVKRGKDPLKISPWLLIIPALLLMPLVVGGLAPAWLLGRVLEPGTTWASGPAIFHKVDLKLWLSLSTYVVGIGLYLSWNRLASLAPWLPGPQRLADGLARAVPAGSEWWSRAAQAGGHPRYLSIILMTFTLVGAAFMARHGVGLADLVGPWGPEFQIGLIPALMIFTGSILMVLVSGRIPKIIMLAVAGYGTVVVYMLFHAPDLALTQVLTESVALILLLLIFRRLPDLEHDTRSIGQKLAHGAVSIIAGLACAALAWGAAGFAAPDPAGAEQLRLSQAKGLGENAVNVILTDFRAVDTLGEIAVLALAAVGIVALHRASRWRVEGEAGLNSTDEEAS